MRGVSGEIYTQAVLLASCLGLGGWLMFCYDLLRISRLLFSAKSWLVSLEDFFYWIYVSLSVFSLLYRQNDGILRSYVIIAVLLGMLAYDRMISRNMLKVLQKMLERIKINNQKRKKFRKKISEKRQIGDTDEE
ncbi:MAG: spore cortex biosynthesis protein YabQ [Lachnospiraceae bacterium]|jgi:spore cortex biosynthesis protein YabQ|nr:spore cortex biosynthesis protein YabQ [Lachnospiraceae bacterium]